MKTLVKLSCRAYDLIVSLHAESLQFRYGGEMKQVFRDWMHEASERGLMAMAKVWATVGAEMIALLGPVYAAKSGVLVASIAGSTVLVLTIALGFCTIGPVVVVHGYSTMPVDTTAGSDRPEPGADPGRKERLVKLPDGHSMFLSCKEPKSIHGVSTVILAAGRGIGDHTGWVPVQEAVSSFDRVCSYDPLGMGLSDKQPVAHTMDELIEQMHTLFEAAQLPKPYVLVGTSLGGVLIRRYESRYPAEVGGFVFVDSSHEEMEWRDAAISAAFDPAWNDDKSLRANGLLAKGVLSQWHDDVPIVVLERGERAPCEAFPGLTQTQCDGINDAWHDFQVDLSHRSKYAQLRVVKGAGHRMAMQKPEVVAQAVHDVIDQMDQIAQMAPPKH